MRLFCRRSLTEAGGLKSCATLLCCHWLPGKITGITPNDIKAARDRNDARYFAAALGLKEKDILPYLRQNYALNDVLHAALLAQASGSTAESILAAHRPPTHDWSYVAYELDVSREKLDAIREKIASVK